MVLSVPVDVRTYARSRQVARARSKSLLDKEVDLGAWRDYIHLVRAELEILTRAWCRPFPGLCAGLFVLGAIAARYSALSHYLPVASYVAALIGVTLALDTASRVERAAWSRSAWRHDLQLLTGAGVAALLLTWSLRLAVGGLPDTVFGVGSLLGCGHLAALALVIRRAPLGPHSRALGFLAAATVLPALAPVLRPLLDASLLFHAEHFPRWSTALPPILSLIVIAIALPAHSQAVPAGDPAA